MHFGYRRVRDTDKKSDVSLKKENRYGSVGIGRSEMAFRSNVWVFIAKSLEFSQSKFGFRNE